MILPNTRRQFLHLNLESVKKIKPQSLFYTCGPLEYILKMILAQDGDDVEALRSIMFIPRYTRIILSAFFHFVVVHPCATEVLNPL